MRMMLSLTIPVEAGNEAARTGALGSTMEKILTDMKAEAAYFTATPAGERGGVIIFDLKDASQIPSIAEPLFLAFNAKITIAPVMTPQDLAKAVPSIAKAVKAYGKAASA